MRGDLKTLFEFWGILFGFGFGWGGWGWRVLFGVWVWVWVFLQALGFFYDYVYYSSKATWAIEQCGHTFL